MQCLKSFNKRMKKLAEKKKRARTNLLDFIEVCKKDYKPAWFHRKICKELTQFSLSDKPENQMLFMPPQNGKSEISSKHLPAFLLGQDPKLRIAVISYNSTIASGFGKAIKRIMCSNEYKSIFPNTKIFGNDPGIKKGALTSNDYMFETSEGGYVINVGVGGSLTSKTVDVFIFDDMYKGPMDAWSSTYRQRVQDFYNTVAGTRGHSKEKMLILYTRWHEEDIAGVLKNNDNKNKWKQLVFQGVKTNDYNDKDDPRKLGEILWPERHTLEKYKELEILDPVAYDALVQQEPKSRFGLMYPNNLKYTREQLKEALENGILKCYVDTADEGADHLAAIFYVEYKGKCYVLDIIYTKLHMEATEPMVAALIKKYNIRLCHVESNNGGKGFAREVKKLIKVSSCSVRWFHQSDNKQVRIFSQRSNVMNNILFPTNWELTYPQAYNSYKTYKIEGKNDFDDFQDALTGCIEKLTTGKLDMYGQIGPITGGR